MCIIEMLCISHSRRKCFGDTHWIKKEASRTYSDVHTCTHMHTGTHTCTHTHRHTLFIQSGNSWVLLISPNVSRSTQTLNWKESSRILPTELTLPHNSPCTSTWAWVSPATKNSPHISGSFQYYICSKHGTIIVMLRQNTYLLKLKKK